MLKDPLHYTRTLLRHLRQTSTRIVDRTAAAEYGENGKAIKTGTMATQYLPNRKEKYADQICQRTNSNKSESQKHIPTITFKHINQPWS